MGRSWAKDRPSGREYLEAESDGLRSKGNEGGRLDGAMVDIPRRDGPFRNARLARMGSGKSGWLLSAVVPLPLVKSLVLVMSASREVQA